MSSSPINADDLNAHVDGRLASDRAAKVAAYLAEHSEADDQVTADLLIRAELRAALAPVGTAPLPPELLLTSLMADREARRTPAWRIAAASAFCLGLGASAGWLARGVMAPPTSGVAALGREAAYSYRTYVPSSREPVEVASSDRIRLARWISGRLKRSVSLPDLSQAGYQLTGGRLVATPHGPAGLFLYRSRSGSDIAVFVRPMEVQRDTAPMRQDISGVGGYAWAHEGIGYAVSSVADAGRLSPVVAEMRRQSGAMM